MRDNHATMEAMASPAHGDSLKMPGRVAQKPLICRPCTT
jgi:hypothetical protein